MIRLVRGDCRDVLRTLPDGAFQCCVTSPPYYGLRDYGVAGQIGLEPTPDEYVAQMVAVFREVRRVLRDDGTVFLNLGDSYHNLRTHNNGGVPTNTVHRGGTRDGTEGFGRANRNKRIDGIKDKDLLGIPWMVAFALRADGWWLRSAIVWHKPNPMTESMTDRPTSAYEHVFLLAKSARYFYDAEAVAEPSDQPERVRADKIGGASHKERGQHSEGGNFTGSATRNARNVWTIATHPYSGAHFATMPPDLAERCIRAGTSERGQCPECGAPWGRVVERSVVWPKNRGGSNGNKDRNDGGLACNADRTATTTGWAASCACPPHAPVPQHVLDPFGGTGTTGMVADRLRRHATLIELNPAYNAMATERVTDDAPLFAEVVAPRPVLVQQDMLV